MRNDRPQAEKSAGRVIVVTGPVGAGKSAVARELLSTASEPTAYIEGDTFWSHIVMGPRSFGRQKSFRAIMRAMSAAALAYALTGYEVVLDFSIPPWFLDTLRKMILSRGVALDYVVLKPSVEICAERAASRTEGQIANYAPYRDLYADFEDSEEFVICEDTADAATVAAQIRSELTGEKYRISASSTETEQPS